jgi:uncharacterized BrkB/YihY/UPF0761 family membrane protein
VSDPPPADPQTPESAAPKPSAKERYADARRRVEELRSTAEARFETERHRRNWVRLAVRAWERDRDRAGALIAGGLAYRIFLWQIPAALFIVAIVGALSVSTDADAGEVARSTGMTAAVAAVIAQGAEDAGTSSWLLLILGLWGMAWAGRGAARALRLVSRLAYEVPAPPISVMKASLVFNGFMFLALFVQLISGEILGGGAVAFIVAAILSVLITLGVATFGMTLLPRGDRPWTVVLPGALLFGVAVVGMRVAIDVYFGNRLDRATDPGEEGPVR